MATVNGIFFLCCTSSVAFGTVEDAIILNRDVTCSEFKTLLNEKFCIVKSEIWKFFLRKTNKRGKFFMADRSHSIKQNINEIARIDIVNIIDEYLCRNVKLFQLHGSRSFESLIYNLQTKPRLGC